MEGAKETNFGTKVAYGEDDARTSNTRIARAHRKAEKHAIPHSTMKNMTLVTETGDVQ